LIYSIILYPCWGLKWSLGVIWSYLNPCFVQESRKIVDLKKNLQKCRDFAESYHVQVVISGWLKMGLKIFKLPWTQDWLQGHHQFYLFFPRPRENGSFPLKIWSWSWYDLGLRPQNHSKIILNVKFHALSESGVKNRGSYLKNRSWFSNHLENGGQEFKITGFWSPFEPNNFCLKNFSLSCFPNKIIEIKD